MLNLRESADACLPHLREFEDVLGAVDDPEGAVGQPLADVSGMEPAVGVYSLPRLLRVLVVALAVPEKMVQS